MPLESNIKQNSLAISVPCEMIHKNKSTKEFHSKSLTARQITFSPAPVTFQDYILNYRAQAK